MAEDKKLYWFKLTDSFMTSENVDYIMSQKKGEKYIIIYQMLCLKCLNTNGILGRKLGKIFVPFETKKLVRDFKYFTEKEITTALTLFEQLGLIYKKDKVLVIDNFDRLIGSESKWAEYKRNERERNIGHSPKKVQKKTIQSKSKELDKDKDKDKDIYNNTTVVQKEEIKCLLGFQEKHAKIQWCYENCLKCNECKLPNNNINNRNKIEINDNDDIVYMLDNLFKK